MLGDLPFLKTETWSRNQPESFPEHEPLLVDDPESDWGVSDNPKLIPGHETAFLQKAVVPVLGIATWTEPPLSIPVLVAS
jgi:hypothetical protein